MNTRPVVRTSSASTSTTIETLFFTGAITFLPFFFIVLMPVLAVFCVCHDVLRFGRAPSQVFESYSPEEMPRIDEPILASPVEAKVYRYDDIVPMAHKEAV